jgi:hypothetical protein
MLEDGKCEKLEECYNNSNKSVKVRNEDVAE